MESDSDNESPEVISNTQIKSIREQEIMQMFQQKRKIRDEQKLKRKLKAEKFAAQKKEKQAREKELLQQNENEDDDDEGKDVTDELDPTTIPSDPIAPLKNVIEELRQEVKGATTRSGSRKFYPKYNVSVENLTKVSNPRATSALDFRKQRMAKVHREAVASNLLSYKEKMQIKNT